MKINKSIIKASLYVMVAGAIVSCTTNFEDINQDPYAVSPDEMDRDGYNISSAIVGMQSWVIPTTVNTYQFTDSHLGGTWSGYLATSHPKFNGSNFSTYSAPDNWSYVMFKDIIPPLYSSYKMLKSVTTDPVPLAIADVIKVAALHRVTDCYGPIPYSQIGAGGQLKAPYDSQKDVYNKMFEELSAAITTLTAHRTESISANADKVFGGNVTKWIRFANSLKLRLAMRLAYVDATTAKTMAEEAVAHEVGVMNSNADNAALSSFGKDGNPLHKIMYEYNGGDMRVGADITSYMNGYNDPRRAVYFTQSTFAGGNGFHGLRSGIDIAELPIPQQYSNALLSPNSPLVWMNSSEVAFLRAEGALRGWNMGGSAESFYNTGIRLSFEQLGVNGADTYMANTTYTPINYADPMNTNTSTSTPSTIKIRWNQGGSSFETNLERIITQKWIANFPLGQEAWAEYRRTGYPRLMPVVKNLSPGLCVDSNMGARRLPYPLDEYTTNATNVSEAVATKLNGADNMATQVWWDCKN